MNFGKSKFLSNLLSFQDIQNRQANNIISRIRKRKKLPYVIVRPDPKEHCLIVEQLWRYFYPDEPTIVALGLAHKYNPVFDEDAAKSLAEGLSLVAKCKYNGDIVGASVNKTICPWDPKLIDQLSCSMSCERMREFLNFNSFVMRAPCLWERYCTNKIFEISQVYIRTEDRRKGLGLLLMDASRKLAADCGFKVIRVDATSFYTTQICRKLKMQLAFEIPYCAYTGRGPRSEPVFKTPPPHDTCRVYIDTPFL